MITSYDIGSLAARVKLTVLATRSGGVIRSGLVWRLKGSNQEYTSQAAQPILDIPAGEYMISLTYTGKIHELSTVTVAKNTLTDLLFTLADAGEYQPDGYHAEFDATQNFERRLSDRQDQERFGHAELPLHDPNVPKGDQGVHFQDHPLLNTAQFDGMEAKVNPQPSENEEASEKTLELILQHQNELKNNPNSTPKLTR